MKAAVCRAFGEPLTIEELQLAAPKRGEVQVSLRACAICHSDVSYADGYWGGALPAVYGHEAAGLVKAIGEGVEHLAPGDHVVVTLIRYCGRCYYCAAGDQVLCEEVFELDRQTPITAPSGENFLQAMRTGAFAENVVVHHSQVVAVPTDIPFEEAALLSCGVITGYGAVTRAAGLVAGETAVVIGCGGVGLNAVQAAALSGARVVAAVDVSDQKLEAARQFGATHVFNSRNMDTPAAVFEATEGRGADYAFVTVGSVAAIEGAFSYLTRRGTVVVVGMPPSGAMAKYEPATLAGWNQRIIGSKMGSAHIAEDIPMLIELYRQGRLKLRELISGRYSLEEINEAMDGVRRGEAMRNVVLFGETGEDYRGAPRA